MRRTDFARANSCPKLRISRDFRRTEIGSAQVRGRVALNRLILPTLEKLEAVHYITTSIVPLPPGHAYEYRVYLLLEDGVLLIVTFRKSLVFSGRACHFASNHLEVGSIA
jgi:hypothetical protein